MSALPASGYPSNASRTEGEMKQYFEDIRSNVEEHLGGAAESELTISGGSITPRSGRILLILKVMLQQMILLISLPPIIQMDGYY